MTRAELEKHEGRVWIIVQGEPVECLYKFTEDDDELAVMRVCCIDPSRAFYRAAKDVYPSKYAALRGWQDTLLRRRARLRVHMAECEDRLSACEVQLTVASREKADDH
jgi:hypothetical protein